MKNILSFSGGKDSTAMLLMAIDKNVSVDEIVVFDTGWDTRRCTSTGNVYLNCAPKEA